MYVETCKSHIKHQANISGTKLPTAHQVIKCVCFKEQKLKKNERNALLMKLDSM